MKIKCIIVDDEPIAISIIEKHINKLNDIDIVATCESAIEAFSILQKEHVDLIFLDIQMPELTGIDFIKTLSHPPKVIITTAYREYAIEGFDLEVVDYLLKPISFERFLKAINKVYKLMPPELILQHKIKQVSSEQNDSILVKVKRKMVKINFNDILFIESKKDYVCIKVADKEIHTKILTKDMEKQLPEEKFLRIHRSFIVSLKKITAVSPNTVEIENFEIPIGRSYKSLVMKKMNYNHDS